MAKLIKREVYSFHWDQIMQILLERIGMDPEVAKAKAKTGDVEVSVFDAHEDELTGWETLELKITTSTEVLERY